LISEQCKDSFLVDLSLIVTEKLLIPNVLVRIFSFLQQTMDEMGDILEERPRGTHLTVSAHCIIYSVVILSVNLSVTLYEHCKTAVNNNFSRYFFALPSKCFYTINRHPIDGAT